MTKDEFISFAIRNNISERRYSIDGEIKGSDVTYIRYSFGKWEVYYSERGKTIDLETFYNESDAVDNLYKRFKKSIERGWKYDK